MNGAEPVVAAIRERIDRAGLSVDDRTVAGCAHYFELLARWNRRINLTALPLSAPVPDASVDKLIVEPLVASAFVPDRFQLWIDLGSGGGSPAIPLRLAHPVGRLVMVESRERKCAFLREAVRTLGLARTDAQAVRFESFTADAPADLVTVRAVRLDESLIHLINTQLRHGGVLMSFGSRPPSGFTVTEEAELPDSSTLWISSRPGPDDVPRGTGTSSL